MWNRARDGRTSWCHVWHVHRARSEHSIPRSAEREYMRDGIDDYLAADAEHRVLDPTVPDLGVSTDAFAWCPRFGALPVPTGELHYPALAGAPSVISGQPVQSSSTDHRSGE